MSSPLAQIRFPATADAALAADPNTSVSQAIRRSVRKAAREAGPTAGDVFDDAFVDVVTIEHSGFAKRPIPEGCRRA
jgi:hypothetical protein